MSDFNFGAWLSQNNPSIVASSAPLRAQVQHARILDKPETVTLKRGGDSLDPQTVRVEWTESLTEENSELGVATMRRGYLMGYKDHPTLPDLDVQEWDVFRMYNQEYTIVSVNYHLIGQIQAAFQAV